MASDSIPVPPSAPIDVFHEDSRRLERRDWRLWTIASLFIVLMFSTIATLALEIERRGVEILSGAQLDAAVHGLLTMVLLFALFVVHQQITISRTRRMLFHVLRQELARSAEKPASDAAPRD